MVLLFAGCSSGTSTDPKPEENKNGDTKQQADDQENGEIFELGSEPLDITMFGNYDWYTMPPWGEDVSTGHIKEKWKVDVQAIDGGGDAAQKLGTMIADGKLPGQVT